MAGSAVRPLLAECAVQGFGVPRRAGVGTDLGEDGRCATNGRSKTLLPAEVHIVDVRVESLRTLWEGASLPAPHAHRLTIVDIELRRSDDAASGGPDPEDSERCRSVRRLMFVLSLSALLASLTVLLTVGYHASLLGDVPLSFDPDRAREDIWQPARSHYLRIATAAALLFVGSWIAVLSTWPHSVRINVLSVAAARCRLAALVAASVLSGGALALSPYFLSLSRPMFAGVIALILTAAALSAGVLLKDTGKAAPDLVGAATVVVIPALTVAPAFATLSLAHQFFPHFLMFVPLGTYALWLAVGVPLSVAVISWWWKMLRPAAVTSPAAIAYTRPHRAAAQGWSAAEVVVAALIVLVVGVGAAWAAQPVHAPSAQTVSPFRDRPVEIPAVSAAPWPGDRSDSAANGPSEPQRVPQNVDACRPHQLDIVALGDRAEYAVLVATNISEGRCALTGHVSLRLMQGNEKIDLRPVADFDQSPVGSMELGAVLEPGGHAHAELSWPGYGTAADHETPQQLYVMVDSSTGAEAQVRLQIAEGSEELGLDGTVTPIPAPFDLKAGVEGGAEIRTGVWTPGL